MKRRLLLAALLLASCSQPAPPRQAEKSNEPGASPTDIVNERSSILDLSRGATIVSRTGELALPISAVNLIDGEIGPFWSSPGHDFPQSFVIALNTRSRIDRIGIRSIAGSFEAKNALFERSLDGMAWIPMATLSSKETELAQWMDVPPAEASYLRVTIDDSFHPGQPVRVQSLLAHGTEVAPRVDRSIAGCWSVNGTPASFTERDGLISGVRIAGALPTYLEGATNGRIWRFNWMHGNDFGYSVLTVAPDATHLSGLDWHEEAIPLFRGLPWFGEKATNCSVPPEKRDLAMAIVRRSGRLALFGLQFDDSGTLVAGVSRGELQSLATILRAFPAASLSAHEFRQSTPAGNKAIAQREIDSLKAALVTLGADLSKVTFRAPGSDAPRQNPESDVSRAIYSSVELEVRR